MNPFFFSKEFLFFCAAIVVLCASHSCSHDTDKDLQDFYKKFAEEFNKDNLNKRRFLSNEEQRILSEATLSPIRVTTDMTGLNTGTITPTQKTYLTSLVQTVVKFLSNFLKVVSTPGYNIFKNGDLTTCIGDVKVPANDMKVGIPNSDLHLYVIYENNPVSSYLANAGWCSLYTTLSLVRPNFGRIKFNLGQMAATGTVQAQYQNDLMVILHETIHVLGFSGWSMQYWLNPAKNQQYEIANLNLIQSTEIIRGFTTTILKSTNVLNTARKYYSCPTLSGMQIENQGQTGSIGSHWERTIIESEVMTASAVNEGSNLTYFTVALLKDTGFWGDVNENLTDPIYWGKEKGCNFPIQACNASGSFEEFSLSGHEGCTFWNDGQGYATTDIFSDNCFYMVSYSNNLCENPDNTSESNNISLNPIILDQYSYNSKCFYSNVINPSNPHTTYSVQTRCHKYQCSSDSTVITITSGYLPGFSLICNLEDAGQVKTAFYNNSQNIGQITCPSNFQKFCDNQNCKNFCSFNGICIRGMCMCNPGRTSDDCSMTCSVYSESGACVSACSSGKFANMDNVCRETCPKGFYPENGVCNLCDFSCSTCSGPGSSQCNACQFLTYLSGNTCVQTCPTGTYADETSKSCMTCTNGCANCISGTVCGSCKSGFNKIQDLCFSLSCDSSCATCTSISTQCISCKSGNYLNQTANTCGATCPSGFFPNSSNSSNGTCTQCSTGCTACSSGSICTECNVPGYRLLGNSCTLCQSPCSTCLSDVTKCTACERGKYILNNVCYDNCPEYYYNSSNYQCAGCITGCLKCPNGNTCTECNTNNYKLYSFSSAINRCITQTTCFSPCVTCNPYQPTQCRSCVDTYKLQGNVCQQFCDAGFYADSSNVCYQCDKTCTQCTGTSVTCTACPNPMNLSKNLCVSTCPSGEVAMNNVCSKPIIATKTFQEILHMFLTISILFLII